MPYLNLSYKLNWELIHTDLPCMYSEHRNIVYWLTLFFLDTCEISLWDYYVFLCPKLTARTSVANDRSHSKWNDEAKPLKTNEIRGGKVENRAR